MQVTRSAQPSATGSMPASATAPASFGSRSRAAQHLVDPVLEADRRVAVDHALEREALADADVDDGAVDRAEHLAQPAHPAGEQPLHDRVAGGVLLGVLAGRRLRGARAPRPIGRLDAARGHREVALGGGVEVAAPAEVHHQLAEQAERQHLHGHHDEQHAELAGPGGCRSSWPSQLRDAHPGEQHAARRAR